MEIGFPSSGCDGCTTGADLETPPLGALQTSGRPPTSTACRVSPRGQGGMAAPFLSAPHPRRAFRNVASERFPTGRNRLVDEKSPGIQ